ncbi:MAG: VOC family protein [Syntrophomonadaceae bacterium]
MISRTWHGVVPREKAEAYYEYLQATGIPDYRKVAGNQGVFILRRDADSITHFTIISLWSSFEAIREFAGDDVGAARYYDRDRSFLLELEPHVTHDHVLFASDEASGSRSATDERGGVGSVIRRYAFVALTTTDLARQRTFWVDQLGFAVSEEKPGEFFIVDAGGLRLCVDLAEGDVHVAGGTDPVIGLKVDSVAATLAELDRRGVAVPTAPTSAERGSYAVIRDPDGRAVILTETD